MWRNPAAIPHLMKITLKEQRILAELLQNWFNNVDLDSKNFLNQNIVAKIIKKEMKKRGKWRNKRKIVEV